MSNVAPNVFDIGAECLGYYGVTATYRRPLDGRRQPSVFITSAAISEDGVFEPAQSVMINSRVGLLALRDVIDKALGTGPVIDGAGPA